MTFNIGLGLLFFLPLLEDAEKGIGFALLLSGSVFVGLSVLKKNIKFDIIDLLFFLFLLFASISTVLSLSPSRSFAELMRYASYFILFISIRRIDIKQKGSARTFFIWSVLVNGFMLSLLSLSFFSPKPLFPIPIGGMNLYFAAFGHNHLAGLLLIVIPLTFSLICESIEMHNQKRKSLYIVLLLFFLVSLIFTYSRAAYILVILYFLVFVSLKISVFKTRWVYFFSGLAIIIFLAFQFIFFYSFKEQKISFLPKQFYKPIKNREFKFDYFQQALTGLKLSPVLGTGPDTFRFVSTKYKEVSHQSSWFTHNHFLQLFSETGLPGGSIFLLLILAGIWKIYNDRSFETNTFNFGLFLGVIGTIGNNLVDYDWQFLSIFLYFWIALALLLPNLGTFSYPKENSAIVRPLTGLFLFMSLFSISIILGKLFYSLAKYKISNNILLLSISSNLIPWQASHQQSLGQLASEVKNFDLTRFYNNKAMRLEPKESSYYTFRAYMEDGLGNISVSKKYHSLAIATNPFDTPDSYLSIYKLMLLEAKKSLEKENFESAYANLDKARIIFPKLAEDASASAYLTNAKKKFQENDKKEALRELNRYINRGVKSIVWLKLNDKELEYSYKHLF